MSIRNEIIIKFLRAHAEKYPDCPITAAWNKWNEQAVIFEKMLSLVIPAGQLDGVNTEAAVQPPVKKADRKKSSAGKKSKRQGGVLPAKKVGRAGGLTKKQAEALDMVIVLHKSDATVTAKGLAEATEKSAATCSSMLKTLHGNGFIKELRDGSKITYLPLKNTDGSKIAP